MIIATAGHVDHGKTSLVRALTGIDTDRLPEEKARGLTIDLGFAYVPLPDGRLFGFVDVPGHQRFLKNMLAGVGNVDHALVVVAADDGVMPQTVEHVEILDLLDVAHATVAITKTDKAAPGRCDCPRCSRSRIRACCKCRSFANASTAARGFCSRPARIPISGSAIVGRRRP